MEGEGIEVNSQGVLEVLEGKSVCEKRRGETVNNSSRTTFPRPVRMKEEDEHCKMAEGGRREKESSSQQLK